MSKMMEKIVMLTLLSASAALQSIKEDSPIFHPSFGHEVDSTSDGMFMFTTRDFDDDQVSPEDDLTPSDDEDDDDFYSSYSYVVDLPETDPNEGEENFEIPISVGYFSPGTVDTPESHSASDASFASAEAAFLSTPLGEDYQNTVYYALSDVRDSCEMDYQNICAIPTLQSFGESIFSIMASNVFSGIFPSAYRRRLDAHFDRMNNPLSSVLHSHPQLGDMASKFAHFREQFKPKAELSNAGDAFPGPGLVSPPPHGKPVDIIGGFTHSHTMHFQDSIRPLRPLVNFGTVSSSTQNQLRGNMRQLNGFREDRTGSPCPHHEHRGGAVYEDRDKEDSFRHSEEVEFTELLYGPGGDQCMLANYELLSEECQDSILTLNTLRAQYLHEDEESHGSHPGFFFFFALIGIFLAIVVIKKSRARRAQYKRDMAMYNALQSNPELKTQLETASGVTFDQPRDSRCSAKKCGFFFLRILCSFVIGIVVVHFAIFVTILSMEALISTDEDGNETLPSSVEPVALFIFVFFVSFLVLSLLTWGIIALVHKMFSPGITSCDVKSEARAAPAANTFFRLPSWISAPPVSGGYSFLSNSSVHGNGQPTNELVVMQPSAPRTIVLTNFPSTATCVTPVNII